MFHVFHRVFFSRATMLSVLLVLCFPPLIRLPFSPFAVKVMRKSQDKNEKNLLFSFACTCNVAKVNCTLNKVYRFINLYLDFKFDQNCKIFTKFFI